MKIWLDDERDPLSPIVQKEFPTAKNGKWTWIKTVEEAEPFVFSGQVEFISFDNDLGEGNAEGRKLALKIEEKAYLNEMQPIGWEVHSKNVIGANEIAIAMSNADRFWQQHKELNSSVISWYKIAKLRNY